MPYILRLPSRYMAEDATEKDKKFCDFYKARLDEINNGLLNGIVFPSDRDEMANKLFDLEFFEGDRNEQAYSTTSEKFSI